MANDKRNPNLIDEGPTPGASGVVLNRISRRVYALGNGE